MIVSRARIICCNHDRIPWLRHVPRVALCTILKVGTEFRTDFRRKCMIRKLGYPRESDRLRSDNKGFYRIWSMDKKTAKVVSKSIFRNLCIVPLLLTIYIFLLLSKLRLISQYILIYNLYLITNVDANSLFGLSYIFAISWFLYFTNKRLERIHSLK